jgi:hypothetical protein
MFPAFSHHNVFTFRLYIAYSERMRVALFLLLKHRNNKNIVAHVRRLNTSTTSTASATSNLFLGGSAPQTPPSCQVHQASHSSFFALLVRQASNSCLFELFVGQSSNLSFFVLWAREVSNSYFCCIFWCIKRRIRHMFALLVHQALNS